MNSRKLVQGDTDEDKLIECCDCGDQFLFQVGEQQFFAARQLLEPRRCKTCRVLKRQSMQR